MKVLVGLLVGPFSRILSKPQKTLVGATGFEPVTSTV